MRRALFTAAVLFAAAVSASGMTGVFRDDYIFTYGGNKVYSSNILENRINIEHRTEAWKFFGDLRLLLYSGLAEEAAGESDFRLMRCFIRYYSRIGTFTIGRTYVALGNFGVFNPFERDKEISMSDISYDRSGADAFVWDIALGELSGIRSYIAPNAEFDESSAGVQIFGNMLRFDAGAVINRLAPGRNVAGIFFKGDLLTNISGSFAYHFNDGATENFFEGNVGFEHFFSAKFFVQALYYYNESGANAVADYSGEAATDRYFQARHYLFFNTNFIFDEFFSAFFYAFGNLVDSSAILTPGAKWTLNNGLDLTFQVYGITGTGEDEFSMAEFGKFGGMIRFEAKF